VGDEKSVKIFFVKPSADPFKASPKVLRRRLLHIQSREVLGPTPTSGCGRTRN
jgi:hypothetical protein